MTLLEERVGQDHLALGEPDVTVDLPAAAAALPAVDDLVVEASPRRPLTARLGDRLPGRWVPVLVGAWLTIFSLGVAMEPAPAAEDAFPLVGMAFATVLMGCWMAMASGFVQRRRYGALASAVGASCLLAMTVGCPLSGHHGGLGGWWWFQLAGSLTLLGVSRAALASK
jgi:hypothetical protein